MKKPESKTIKMAATSKIIENVLLFFASLLLSLIHLMLIELEAIKRTDMNKYKNDIPRPIAGGLGKMILFELIYNK